MFTWLSHNQQNISFQTTCRRQLFTGIAGIHEPAPNFAGIKDSVNVYGCNGVLIAGDAEHVPHVSALLRVTTQ